MALWIKGRLGSNSITLWLSYHWWSLDSLFSGHRRHPELTMLPRRKLLDQIHLFMAINELRLRLFPRRRRKQKQQMMLFSYQKMENLLKMKRKRYMSINNNYAADTPLVRQKNTGYSTIFSAGKSLISWNNSSDGLVILLWFD